MLLVYIIHVYTIIYMYNAHHFPPLTEMVYRYVYTCISRTGGRCVYTHDMVALKKVYTLVGVVALRNAGKKKGRGRSEG